MARTPDPLVKPKLLRAARQEFAAVGLSQARVEDIARRAKVAKGSFYLHFKSKEQAFYEIIDHFVAELHAVASAYQPQCAVPQSLQEAMELFQQHDEEILECLWKNRETLRMVFYGGTVRGDRCAHVLDAFLDAQVVQIAEAVGELQRRGVYASDFDAHTAAWVLAGGWFNLARRMTQLSAKPDLKSWSWALRRLFGQGLAPR